MFEKKLHHLEHLLSPRSIAIVGASHDKKKIGAIVLRNIIDGGFAGKIYPVNPSGGIYTFTELPADTYTVSEEPFTGYHLKPPYSPFFKGIPFQSLFSNSRKKSNPKDI